MIENTLEDKYASIKQEVLRCKSDNPIEIAQKIMRKNFVNVHGPEHHFLDGAAFLGAFKNAGGAIELDLCLTELASRTIKMPGAMCGYWGVCGSVTSIGAAFSIINGTGPLSNDEYYKHNMEYTSAILKEMSNIGGARCCKRNAYLSISHAVEFVKKIYGIEMKLNKIHCEFFPLNKQCLKERCPFYNV